MTFRPWGRFKRMRVMLDIAPTAFTASATRGEEVDWEARTDRDEAEPLVDSLAAFLTRLPRRGRMARSPSVMVRVGADLAQVRRLHGLPQAPQPALLSAVVREGIGRFFIGTDLVTSEVVTGADGAPWAAAFRRSSVMTIAGAVRSAGLRLEGIVPRDAPALAAPLPAEGGDVVPARRMVLAIGGCAMAVIAAAVAPGISANRAAERARAELDQLSVSALGALAERAALDSVTAILDAHAAADARRGSTIDFFARLAAALPPATALMMVRLDSAGGTVIAIGPRAAAVVSRLDSMPSVLAPEIVGPVTREVAAGTERERVTVRFARKVVQ